MVRKARPGTLGARLAARPSPPEPKPSTIRIVSVKAAGRCSFSDCRQLLFETDGPEASSVIVLGKVAHIVARSEDGPRGKLSPPGGAVNGHANLMLLCPTHHELVDRDEATYTVERLVGIKLDHERWVREQLSIEESGAKVEKPRTDTIHSTLLQVERVPERLYLAPCSMTYDQVKEAIRYPTDSSLAFPFDVRSNSLIAFTSLSDDTPFSPFIDATKATFVDAALWWDDPDKSRWYMTLMNRAMHKLTGRRGLRFDFDHKRYYFEPDRNEQGFAMERELTHQPLNQSVSTRFVVYQPKRHKKDENGQTVYEKRNYWVHLAAHLRMMRVGAKQWALAIRPEHRFTKDGFELLPSMSVGPRATRLKSHLYNYQLLAELHFWKEYLSNSQPRIILDFSGQALVIDAQLMQASVTWQGVPNDDLPFTNVSREDDLFTSAEYEQALSTSQHEDAELEKWEASDFNTMIEQDDVDPEKSNE